MNILTYLIEFGTPLAAAASAVAAVFSWRTAVNLNRKAELREATSALIGAIHDLALNCDDLTRDNKTARAKTYQMSVLFELAAAGRRFDQPRFNAAMNWILKASGMRRNYSALHSKSDKDSPHRLHFTFVNDLVFQATESLRMFDKSRGKFKISEDLALRFGELCDGPYSRIDSEIREILKQDYVETDLYQKLLHR